MTNKEEQAALAKGVWCDSYRFYLKYHGCSMGPVMWDEAIKDFGEVNRKYGNAALCVRMMLAAFSQIEEETR